LAYVSGVQSANEDAPVPSEAERANMLSKDAATSETEEFKLIEPDEEPMSPIAGADPFVVPFQPFDPNNWDPWKEMEQMRRQMDAMFNQTFQNFRQNPGFRDWDSISIPRMDMTQSADEITITLDMPGVEKPEIDVEIDGDTLTIQGKQTKVVEENQGDRVLRQERQTGAFNRVITLPFPVDQSQMTTEYENGVLTIHIPRAK